MNDGSCVLVEGLSEGSNVGKQNFCSLNASAQRIRTCVLANWHYALCFYLSF
jgi:hypothetical protein